MLETFQNTIEDPADNSGWNDRCRFTALMDIDELYAYFNSVKTPEKRERVYVRNGTCNIIALNEKQANKHTKK